MPTKKTVIEQLIAVQRPKKKHKFNAKPTVVDGHRFPSELEASRYRTLKLLLQHGKISDLQLQVPFKWSVSLSANGQTIQSSEKYIADFVYTEKGNQVVEDAKGCRTRAYIRKRSIMLKLFDITIRET